MNLKQIQVRPVFSSEESRFQELMHKHHYLGALGKIGENVWYIAIWQNEWVALMSFSAPALKCSARDHWIGWNYRLQFDRLKLLTNNTRFLILPQWNMPNLGSKILSLCQKRLPCDWPKFFGHSLLLLETFVDPRYFQGTIYKAANWFYAGKTKGFQRTRNGYSAKGQYPKMVFLKPLKSNAQELLSRAIVPSSYRTGGSKMILKAEQARSLPYFFMDISDPRSPHGRRHRLPTVLAIASAAILCGMTGYKAISDWAQSLSQKARQRFGCRFENGRYVVPSEYVIRDLLVRVAPVEIDQALQEWNKVYAKVDKSLAIDGKTMCNAIDDQGYQAHIMGAVGHETHTSYTQKKVGELPAKGDEEMKRTNEIKTAAPMLDAIDIQGKDITADALLTQRDFANYLVNRGADYHFTVKGNQPSLFKDIELYFNDRKGPDFIEDNVLEHGRITTRNIWTTTELNSYLNFPHVGQAFVVERHSVEKKTGKVSYDVAYGITSRSPEDADAKRVLEVNRGHWCIENSCHYILDWNYDEDRNRIRKGYGPENITRLRRFAVSIVKSKKIKSVAQKMRQLNRNMRAVFDYLKMTENACANA